MGEFWLRMWQKIIIKIFFALIVSVSAMQYDLHFAAALTFDHDPERIIISTAGIDLPVITAEIAFNTWEVSETTASYGKGSTVPGNIGNSVIFAHARQGLFGALDQVKPGDQIHVFTKYDWFVYTVTELMVVLPEDTDVIKKRERSELTLFTCTGVNDSHRLVVKAVPLANAY